MPAHDLIEQNVCYTSIVTLVYVMGYHKLTSEKKATLNRIFSIVNMLPITDKVAQQAILLRQQRKMALGDALIAATTFIYNLPLVTRNVGDFKHIKGIDIINPFLDKQ